MTMPEVLGGPGILCEVNTASDLDRGQNHDRVCNGRRPCHSVEGPVTVCEKVSGCDDVCDGTRLYGHV